MYSVFVFPQLRLPSHFCIEIFPIEPQRAAAADAPSTCKRPMVPLSASQLPPVEIRADEQIAYYSMAFVCGDPRGYREAVVLGIDSSAGASTALTLDSGEILAHTMMVKRIMESSGRRIAAEKGLWRKLRTYRLVAGVHGAPTRASAFNRAIEGAVRQAFAAVHRSQGVASEDIACEVSGAIHTSCITVAVAPVTDTSVSSAPTSRARPQRRSRAGTRSPKRCTACEDPQPGEPNAATALVVADTGDPPAAHTSRSTIDRVAQHPLSQTAQQTSAEGNACKGFDGSGDQESQCADVVCGSLLVDLNNYLSSIPTRLKRAQIRHQAKKRPGSWHVPR
ncbi:unnamed protein product [Phytophthora fragariaefolia]|uniref:Unnamed protein product n=1 Tax=Phytophthora fragariaefolia TaxID=1490495 RepID=A0A9W7CU72_9STRA|nr:unnamed protein product [Phytophthora fragariaefolia]